MNKGLVVQIRFEPGTSRDLPSKPCSTPWELIDIAQDTITLLAKVPETKWDSCLEKLQNDFDAYLVSGQTANAADWEVMPLERFNTLKNGKPIKVGRSWMVLRPGSQNHPQHSKQNAPYLKNTIIMHPGWAFGDGCHPTTQGSVYALEFLHSRDIIRGKDILDVGTGTGILGIIAGKMGAKSVLCIDIDSEALKIARQNIIENGLDKTISVQDTPVALAPGNWALALANLTISVMIRTFKAITKRLKAPGIIVMSGFKANNMNEIANLVQSYGFKQIWSAELDGWITMIVQQNL